jgi:RsiW-degrading membrane proteinase PrsW (M82 family)
VTTPARKRVDQQRWTVLLPVLGLIALGVCGLVLLGLGTSQTGLLPILVGAVAALLPVLAVIGAYLWVDRWEPEPAKILLLAFLWGACGATITSLVFNQSAHVLGQLIDGGDGSTFAAVVGAPITEEAAKAAFIVVLFLRRRQEFDGVVDGVVYAGVTAAGFAFTENIWYFARVFSDSGFGDLSSGVIALFILRGVLSPFAHPLFTSMTGIGIGIAALAQARWVRVAAPIPGFLVAAGMHSLWNFSGMGTGTRFVTLYLLIMVPVFVGTMWLVLWQRRRERRIVAEQLPDMVARGWVASTEATFLATPQGRRRWRRVVRRTVGNQAARAVFEYQTAVTEMAFLRHRITFRTGDARPDEHQSALLAHLTFARQAAVATPGVM